MCQSATSLKFQLHLKKITFISFFLRLAHKQSQLIEKLCSVLGRGFTVVWLRNSLISIIIWLLTCSQISASLESFRVFQHCKIATGGARLREKHYHFFFVSSSTLRNPVSFFVNTCSDPCSKPLGSFFFVLSFILTPSPSCHPSFFSCWNDTFLHQLTACLFLSPSNLLRGYTNNMCVT